MTPALLGRARAAVAAARAAGRERGFEPVPAVVFDAGGRAAAREREDGSSKERFEVESGEAHGAPVLGTG